MSVFTIEICRVCYGYSPVQSNCWSCIYHNQLVIEMFVFYQLIFCPVISSQKHVVNIFVFLFPVLSLMWVYVCARRMERREIVTEMQSFRLRNTLARRYTCRQINISLILIRIFFSVSLACRCVNHMQRTIFYFNFLCIPFTISFIFIHIYDFNQTISWFYFSQFDGVQAWLGMHILYKDGM